MGSLVRHYPGHMQNASPVAYKQNLVFGFCIPASQSDLLKKKTTIFLQLKPRMVMTPLAISPPSSTPEPDMSSIPQDAATIPHSATPQVLTGRTQNTNPHLGSINGLLEAIIHLFLPPPPPVCIYINKQANTGPNLDRKKIQQLPDHFGPDRPSVVLQQAVQGCIDSAFQQKTVFTLLTQGYGGEKISGVVERRRSGVAQQLLTFTSLPKTKQIKLCASFVRAYCDFKWSDDFPLQLHLMGSSTSSAFPW